MRARPEDTCTNDNAAKIHGVSMLLEEAAPVASNVNVVNSKHFS